MKAVRFGRFGGPEVLEIVDLPDPHPGPGQVRIAVRAASACTAAPCSAADSKTAKNTILSISTP